MRESLAQQRTSGSDCLLFFPALFISSNMTWWREHSLPGQLRHILVIQPWASDLLGFIH